MQQRRYTFVKAWWHIRQVLNWDCSYHWSCQAHALALLFHPRITKNAEKQNYTASPDERTNLRVWSNYPSSFCNVAAKPLILRMKKIRIKRLPWVTHRCPFAKRIERSGDGARERDLLRRWCFSCKAKHICKQKCTQKWKGRPCSFGR